MSARWYKRCGADFIHGTMMLTLEEKGAYSLCLDLIYDRGRPIPDDARWLAGVCGVSLRKWASIRDRLISLGKISSNGTLISNVRADLELVSSELQARKLAESGAKGGRKRAENAGQSSKSKDLAEAPPKLTREDKSREEGISSEIPSAPAKSKAWDCPLWADPLHWKDFLRNRKKKRLDNTETAWKLFLSDLARVSASSGIPPNNLIEVAAGKGWASINDPNDRGQTNGRSQPLQRNRPNLSDQLRAIDNFENAGHADHASDNRTRSALPSLGFG